MILTYGQHFPLILKALNVDKWFITITIDSKLSFEKNSILRAPHKKLCRIVSNRNEADVSDTIGDFNELNDK